VLEDHLVLVCPACQQSTDWMADLQHCDQCASVRLIRRLDQVECLECGMVRVDPAALVPGTDAGFPGDVSDRVCGRTSGRVSGRAGPDPALADEVSRALERVLGGSMLGHG
jgi:hypothetical protein